MNEIASGSIGDNPPAVPSPDQTISMSRPIFMSQPDLGLFLEALTAPGRGGPDRGGIAAARGLIRSDMISFEEGIEWLARHGAELGRFAGSMGGEGLARITGANTERRFRRPRIRENIAFGENAFRLAGFSAMLIGLERLGLMTHASIFASAVAERAKSQHWLSRDEFVCLTYVRTTQYEVADRVFSDGTPPENAPLFSLFKTRNGREVEVRMVPDRPLIGSITLRGGHKSRPGRF